MEKSIFGKLVTLESFRNVIYLLFSFPAGLIYFVFLVTGLSVGAALSIIWVGIPILLIVFEISRGMVEFERYLTNHWLGAEVPPVRWVDVKGQGLLTKIKHRLQDPMMWKGVIYLFTKFPLGILGFVVAITLVALTLALVTAPLTYEVAPITIGIYQLDTLSEAVTVSVVGLGVGLASLWVMNTLTAFIRGYAIRFFHSDNISPRTTEM